LEERDPERMRIPRTLGVEADRLAVAGDGFLQVAAAGFGLAEDEVEIGLGGGQAHRLAERRERLVVGEAPLDRVARLGPPLVVQEIALETQPCYYVARGRAPRNPARLAGNRLSPFLAHNCREWPDLCTTSCLPARRTPTSCSAGSS